MVSVLVALSRGQVWWWRRRRRGRREGVCPGFDVGDCVRFVGIWGWEGTIRLVVAHWPDRWRLCRFLRACVRAAPIGAGL